MPATVGQAGQDGVIPFVIDGKEFNKVDTGTDGTYENDALPMPSQIEVTERYEVAEQKVPGFKALTQATEPWALKELRVTVTTFTKDDLEFMDSLTNETPHEIQCHLFTESPMIMYLRTKHRSVPRTGMQTYAVDWDLQFIECNDNQGA
jgi:hypothetical protein